MFSQHLYLLLKVVFFILTHFLELIIVDYACMAEKILAAVGDELNSEVEPHSLQQPLSCNLVEPVKLESE